jgi:hypothetical protein
LKTEIATGTDTTIDAVTENTLKSKIPADYIELKKAIKDNLATTTTLNATIVNKFASYAVTDKVVDMTKITDKDAFVTEYLKYIIPVLANPEEKFINSKNVDKDTFALAVFGALTGEKYFVE